MRAAPRAATGPRVGESRPHSRPIADDTGASIVWAHRDAGTADLMRTIQTGHPCSDERTQGYVYDDAARTTRYG